MTEYALEPVFPETVVEASECHVGVSSVRENRQNQEERGLVSMAGVVISGNRMSPVRGLCLLRVDEGPGNVTANTCPVAIFNVFK